MKKEYYLKYTQKGSPGPFWYIKDRNFYSKEYFGTPNVLDALFETKDEILNIKEYINYKSSNIFDFYIEKASQDLLDRILIKEIIA